MSDVAIKVHNLSKQYHIGGHQASYQTLRESLTDMVKAPFQRAASLLGGHAYGAAGMDETIWALKDVSFEVKQGEIIGVIGCNGAGKTTLLKVLSRITEPTEGYAKICGRVGSLLEVGTGFHQELTGRENVYLNGAILGMKKVEIDVKFNEIVAFSGLAQFIDTPVKFYSSGMRVRLAFAVAAHLEPEILLIDEVLAVGDAAFQKKCLGKMGTVAKEGRTVMLVSHNMVAIEGLCDQAFWFDMGELKEIGPTGEVIKNYSLANIQVGFELNVTGRYGRQEAQIIEARVLGKEGGNGAVFMGEPFELIIRIYAKKKLPNVSIGIEIHSITGVKLMISSTYRQNLDVELLPGEAGWTCKFESMPLAPGLYQVQLGIGDYGIVDYLPQALIFEVLAKDVLGSGRLLDETCGLLFSRFQWCQTDLNGR